MDEFLLQESLDIANQVLNSLDTVLGYWDRDLKCRFANSAYQLRFGKSAQEMNGISIGKLLGPIFEFTLPHILSALDGEARLFERMTSSSNGAIRHDLVSFYPDRYEGTVRGFSEHVVDITKLKHLEFELQKSKTRAELLATHDFLTGLPNRFLLMDRISASLSQAEDKGTLVGIVLFDIDKFTMINEAYGLNGGDGVITEIARRMKSVIHPNETMVRMSGDDFLYLVTGIHSDAQVSMSVSRVIKAVQQPLQLARASVTPTLSYGTAIFPLNGSDAAALMKVADRALYESRRLREL